MFKNRERAGQRLAEAMEGAGLEIDLVLAVPRGGLPLGLAVADAFSAPLDIIAAKKLGAPGNPELAIGAVAADGSIWVNDSLVAQLSVHEEYISSERTAAMETATKKEETYRDGREPHDIVGKRVAIVDDGVATGATMRACIEAVANAGAAEVIVGIPVGPTDTVQDLERMADVVIVVETPRFFRSVGAHYAEFFQVSDEEAMAYLDR